MRARRLAVGIPVVVLVVAVLAVAVRLVSTSDAANVHTTTAAQALPAPPQAQLPATVRSLWSRPTAQPPGTSTQVDGGTVVVSGGDSLTGVDPATGDELWTYRRGNARLCGWTMQDAVVVAVFAKSHGCRDITALSPGTGERRWYRTLEVPGDITLSSAPGVVVAGDADHLIAVDTVTGLDRWTYRKDGCRFDRPAVGQGGVALIARCGESVQLIGHEAYTAKERWSVALPPASDPVVLAADERVAVVSGTGAATTLTTYDVNGAVLGTVTDGRLALSAGTRAAATAVTSGVIALVWTGSRTTAVNVTSRTIVWSVATSGPPSPPTENVLLAEANAITVRAVATGAVVRRASVGGDAVPAGAVLGQVGARVVATGASTTTMFG